MPPPNILSTSQTFPKRLVTSHNRNPTRHHILMTKCNPTRNVQQYRLFCLPDAKTEVVQISDEEEKNPDLRSGSLVGSTIQVSGGALLPEDSEMPSSGTSVKLSTPACTDLALIDAAIQRHRGRVNGIETKIKLSGTSSHSQVPKSAPPGHLRSTHRRRCHRRTVPRRLHYV